MFQEQFDLEDHSQGHQISISSETIMWSIQDLNLMVKIPNNSKIIVFTRNHTDNDADEDNDDVDAFDRTKNNNIVFSSVVCIDIVVVFVILCLPPPPPGRGKT